MMKSALMIVALASLSACMESGNVAVSQSSKSVVCPGVPHMQTMGDLPVRCGPQQELPYTLQ